jgi:plasmid maintenance system antidote protein VapI
LIYAKTIRMDATRLQTELFTHIKFILPVHLNLVDAVAETLELSTDSAYRRIRGEKPVTFDELGKLAQRFEISIDRFLRLPSDSYIFTGKLANPTDYGLEKWLENTLKQFRYMAHQPYAHLYYIARDLPVPHYFQIPELASFKFFFWQKSLLNMRELKGAKYAPHELSNYIQELTSEIADAFNKIHSSEIWSVETVNSTLRQIEYYHGAGIFKNEDDAMHLCDALQRVVTHLENQAEQGIKFHEGKAAAKGNGNFHIYNNELNVGVNNVFVDMGEVKISYLNLGHISYISTRDQIINDNQLSTTLNIINKSEPLHVVNEKARNGFFNALRARIDVTRQKLTNDA